MGEMKQPVPLQINLCIARPICSKHVSHKAVTSAFALGPESVLLGLQCRGSPCHLALPKSLYAVGVLPACWVHLWQACVTVFKSVAPCIDTLNEYFLEKVV